MAAIMGTRPKWPIGKHCSATSANPPFAFFSPMRKRVLGSSPEEHEQGDQIDDRCGYDCPSL